jgi:hypothetical protein
MLQYLRSFFFAFASIATESRFEVLYLHKIVFPEKLIGRSPVFEFIFEITECDELRGALGFTRVVFLSSIHPLTLCTECTDRRSSSTASHSISYLPFPDLTCVLQAVPIFVMKRTWKVPRPGQNSMHPPRNMLSVALQSRLPRHFEYSSLSYFLECLMA